MCENSIKSVNVIRCCWSAGYCVKKVCKIVLLLLYFCQNSEFSCYIKKKWQTTELYSEGGGERAKTISKVSSDIPDQQDTCCIQKMNFKCQTSRFYGSTLSQYFCQKSKVWYHNSKVAKFRKCRDSWHVLEARQMVNHFQSSGHSIAFWTALLDSFAYEA